MGKRFVEYASPMPPYLNPQLSLEERVEDLLERLTLDEKLDLCSGQDNWYTKPIPRLRMKRFAMTDGPHGIGPHSSGDKECTYFPVGICRAATWNPELSEQMGKALAQEVREIGYQMILGPGINIQRTPLCGRNFEYQTEDPYLNARLVVPMVRGIQSQRIAACVKHFACNNQEQWRLRVNTLVSERALREIYLLGFEAAVRFADAWSIMTCYNRVNGLYGCEHYPLIRDRIMKDWGFRGFIVSDWGATNFVLDPEKCVNAGLSLEMPVANKYATKLLRDLLTQSKFTEAILNDNVKRLLRVMFLVGMFDDPATLPKGSRNTPEHQIIARKTAEEGIVLLKNENQLLPLSLKNLKKIAVFGPNSDKKMSEGGGSSRVKSPYEITPLAGIKEKCGKQVVFTNNPGDADVAVLVVGLNHNAGQDSEEFDRKSLDLPAIQVDLIQETFRANPKTIVVLVNGSPISGAEWLDQIPAVIEMWYAGMEGGRALADIIFGDVNPSGKLPITFPKKLADSPAHASEQTYPGYKDEEIGPQVRYDEGIFVGYRYFDTKGIDLLFPFGHGLSYTTFTYKNLDISPKKLTGDDSISITLEVENSGDRAGAEVAQLYIAGPEASVPRPIKELKGFTKVMLLPNTLHKIVFIITKKELSFFDEATGKWKAEPGTFNVLVGSSSRDIRLQGTFEYSP